MCLNQIDVVGRTTTTNDNEVALLLDWQRMSGKIIATTRAMRLTPVTCKNSGRLTVFIHHRVDSETRLDQRSNPFAFFVYGVAIEQSGADAGAPAAGLKIQREHVSGFNRPALKPDPDRWICVRP